DRTARGEVMQAGDDGRVVVALSGVSPGRGLTGSGTGLVRGWRVAGAGAASRVELDLATSGEIERRFLLPPGDGVAHYRYVVDLKAVGGAVPAPRAAPRSTPTPRRAERPLIVIDAGHGGRDPGVGRGRVFSSA
ncbi:MAG: N-acetylmuramoyl-L-alanine amidase, partial [Hyphomonas sp.]